MLLCFLRLKGHPRILRLQTLQTCENQFKGNEFSIQDRDTLQLLEQIESLKLLGSVCECVPRVEPFAKGDVGEPEIGQLGPRYPQQPGVHELGAGSRGHPK